MALLTARQTLILTFAVGSVFAGLGYYGLLGQRIAFFVLLGLTGVVRFFILPALRQESREQIREGSRKRE
jgi:hypothetical protein